MKRTNPNIDNTNPMKSLTIITVLTVTIFSVGISFGTEVESNKEFTWIILDSSLPVEKMVKDYLDSCTTEISIKKIPDSNIVIIDISGVDGAKAQEIHKGLMKNLIMTFFHEGYEDKFKPDFNYKYMGNGLSFELIENNNGYTLKIVIKFSEVNKNTINSFPYILKAKNPAVSHFMTGTKWSNCQEVKNGIDAIMSMIEACQISDKQIALIIKGRDKGLLEKFKSYYSEMIPEIRNSDDFEKVPAIIIDMPRCN